MLFRKRKIFLRTNFPLKLRHGSALRVLKHKFQPVGKRYTPSRSVISLWDSNAFTLRTKLGKQIFYVRLDIGITLKLIEPDLKNKIRVQGEAWNGEKAEHTRSM